MTMNAADYTAPIPGADPAGSSARFDPRYERTVNEITKLDSPTGGVIDWRLVVEQGGGLLKSTSKDLLIGAHVAYALFALHGIDGLATGMTTLSGILHEFWPGLFPELKRMRARVNALAWFLERVNLSLGTFEVTAEQRGSVEALEVAATRLVEVVRERFGADAPALRPLTDNITRLRQSLPEPAAPAAPEPVSQAQPATAPVAATRPTVAAAPALALPDPPSLASAADATAFLREVGSALASAAGELRRSAASEASSYRMLRVGLWLPVAAAPPAGPGGKTQVPAPPAVLRTQLDLMAASSRWNELLEEAESTLKQYRLWLDPHRHSAQALAALGAAFAPARTALIGELAALLRRLPALVELSFGDGSPLADPQTRAWLEAEVTLAASGGAGGAGASTSTGDDEELAAHGEARKLLAAGSGADAIKLLQARVMAAPSELARFRARLLLARTCLDVGQATIARALYEALDREIEARGLADWDPALVSRCLEGYLLCVRALQKTGRVGPKEAEILYDRLCRLDLDAAMRLSVT